jgi:glutamine synthetase
MTSSPSTYHFGIFDYDATLRARRLPAKQGEAALKGGYSFPNVLYRWDTGESVYDFTEWFGDEACAIEASTRRAYPSARCRAYIADFTGPRRHSPRQVLKRQIARAESLGHRQTAFECEFTVLNETAESLRAKHYERPVAWALDNRCWSADSAGVYADFVTGLEAVMKTLGVPLYGLGTELGPGCLEATLEATDPLKAADDFGLFRNFTWTYCRCQGRLFLAQLGQDFQASPAIASVARRQGGRPCSTAARRA